MAGESLHIGLNSVSAQHYGGWTGELSACEFDAHDMEKLAKKQGFAKRSVLLTPTATADAVTSAIETAASRLVAGDLFFLTYSGHGGQVPDTNSDEADDDFDETWVLYDRQLVDDELYALWATFAPGVRILVLSDSCHSGSAVKATVDSIVPGARGLRLDGDLSGAMQGMKCLPKEMVTPVYTQNKTLYDGIQKRTPSGETLDIGAHVILISGCQDNQTSQDGEKNGLFTATLKTTWKNGAFRGGYRAFWRKIQQAMPVWQSPNFFTTGSPSGSFMRQRPFTI